MFKYDFVPGKSTGCSLLPLGKAAFEKPQVIKKKGGKNLIIQI